MRVDRVIDTHYQRDTRAEFAKQARKPRYAEDWLGAAHPR
jgi:hypothetical protein